MLSNPAWQMPILQLSQITVLSAHGKRRSVFCFSERNISGIIHVPCFTDSAAAASETFAGSRRTSLNFMEQEAQEFTMQPVARIRSEFAEKFGVPRQSGLVAELEAEIVFEPAYRNPDALRGLEEFSHVWLIWVFDRAVRETWSPTVRPPRLGGNARMGVFATRSPFRPNPIALSCVKLAGIRQTADGPVIRVLGADLVDGTPILDIKPYIPYADSHPDAMGGFASVPAGETLEVVIPPELLARIPEAHREALRGVLAQDPRPHYQKDPERIYGFPFAGMEVRFSVDGTRLTVRDIQRIH